MLVATPQKYLKIMLSLKRNHLQVKLPKLIAQRNQLIFQSMLLSLDMPKFQLELLEGKVPLKGFQELQVCIMVQVQVQKNHSVMKKNNRMLVKQKKW